VHLKNLRKFSLAFGHLRKKGAIMQKAIVSNGKKKKVMKKQRSGKGMI
jgi:hypothetical protein